MQIHLKIIMNLICLKNGFLLIVLIALSVDFSFINISRSL